MCKKYKKFHEKSQKVFGNSRGIFYKYQIYFVGKFSIFLLSRARCSLSSAINRFTVLFEMEKSGSSLLFTLNKICSAIFYIFIFNKKDCYFYFQINYKADWYRVKPHGQLVSVSYTYHYASTPDLSTLWSTTTLLAS